MKILLTNDRLDLKGGSETWTMTMFDYLSKKHGVDVYVAKGVNNLINADCSKEKHYDLAIINHNSCLKDTKDWNIETRIFTSHGVIPYLEKPISGADKYIAVSEEVQAGMKEIGFDAEVIRNPIDAEFFTPTPINRHLENILFLNNHARKIPYTEKVIAACSQDYNFRILSDHKGDVKTHISWSDLVITVGRGCYESLACGKNVMVINRFFDGMVTPESIFEFRKNNCSGRRFGFEWTAEDLKKELKKYNPDRNMRGYILEHNNINIIADEYLRSV